MLETNCLSVYSPSFFSSSFEIDCCFLGLNTRGNRYAFSMRHAKPEISIFKLLHCGFQNLWSVIYKSPYILSFFSDCSLLEICLSSKDPAFPVALLKSDWYLYSLFPCPAEPEEARVSSLCLITASRPFCHTVLSENAHLRISCHQTVLNHHLLE